MDTKIKKIYSTHRHSKIHSNVTQNIYRTFIAENYTTMMKEIEDQNIYTQCVHGLEDSKDVNLLQTLV